MSLAILLLKCNLFSHARLESLQSEVASILVVLKSEAKENIWTRQVTVQTVLQFNPSLCSQNETWLGLEIFFKQPWMDSENLN